MPAYLEMRFAKLLIVVLHSVLFYLFYLGATVLRIFLPPESFGAFLALSLVLVLAFLSYPFITAVAFKFFDDLEGGRTPNWKETLQLLKERYLSLLAVSTVVIGAFLIVAFAVFLIFGPSWVAYFRAIEPSFDKFRIIWEAFFVYVILFLVALELPPVLFPVGLIVLLQPSSEYFFAGAVASMVAVFLLAVPVLKVGLWLPHALLGPSISPWDSFSEAYAMATPAVMKKLLKSLLTSVGMAVTLLVGTAFIGVCVLILLARLSLLQVPFLSFGRWPVPVAMLLFAVVSLLFPGIVSLRFYRRRVSVYREALVHPAS